MAFWEQGCDHFLVGNSDVVEVLASKDELVVLDKSQLQWNIANLDITFRDVDNACLWKDLLHMVVDDAWVVCEVLNIKHNVDVRSKWYVTVDNSCLFVCSTDHASAAWQMLGSFNEIPFLDLLRHWLCWCKQLSLSLDDLSRLDWWLGRLLRWYLLWLCYFLALGIFRSVLGLASHFDNEWSSGQVGTRIRLDFQTLRNASGSKIRGREPIWFKDMAWVNLKGFCLTRFVLAQGVAKGHVWTRKFTR